jgi:hypothetical protein
MDIQTEKLGLIEWIASLMDSPTIEKLEAIKKDYFQHQEVNNRISENERESILRGVRDFEEGKTHAHEDVRKIYEKYL